MVLPAISRTERIEGEEDIHHRDESITGLGDTRLVLRYLSSNEDFGPGERLFLGFGLVLPGNRLQKESPFALGDQEAEHTHFTLGDGARKTAGEIQYFRRGEFPLTIGGVLMWEAPLGQNRYGFLPGSQVSASLISMLQTRQILKGVPYGTLSLQARGVDRWDGKKAPNSGGAMAQIGVGLMWPIGPVAVNAGFQYPILYSTNPLGDISSSDVAFEVWSVSLNVRRTFDLSALWFDRPVEEPGEHHHGEGGEEGEGHGDHE